MTNRLVDKKWDEEFQQAGKIQTPSMRIICPYIKENALRYILSPNQKDLKVVTRFNLTDFALGVSDIGALRTLLKAGATIRGIKSLHSKLYIFGNHRSIVTSANLTVSGLNKNHELGLVSKDQNFIQNCHSYFDQLWSGTSKDLSWDQLDGWESLIISNRAAGLAPNHKNQLSDFGENVQIGSATNNSLGSEEYSQRAFVKFLGKSDNRESLSFLNFDLVKESGCHWALTYPTGKRPRAVEDGSTMFIGRLTKDPNDIRIIGRATGMKHVDVRDTATPEEVAFRPWKELWGQYIRVYGAEFVAGDLKNGVSLNELMDELSYESFKSTQHNFRKGTGNVNPRKAFMQQPAVELSSAGFSWLEDRLETAFKTHGQIPKTELTKLDWPEVN